MHISQRQRDEWDEEYDRGRTKKIKQKPIAAPSGSANPFQSLQNEQRERKVTSYKPHPFLLQALAPTISFT